jgi:hypothetical protein
MNVVGTAGSLSNIRQVFLNDEPIYAVADEDMLANIAGEFGCIPRRLEDIPTIPSGANVLLFLERTFITVQLRRALGSAAVFVVPISSFDSGLDAALYTQQLVFRTNYTAACARNKGWLESITNEPGPLLFASEGPADGMPYTDLTCRLGDDLRADTCLDPQVKAGDWMSVGSYCEFALVATSIDDSRSFDINGVVQVAGVLVAQDARATPAGAARCREGRRLREAMAASGPISLTMENGRVASVSAGTENYTEALLAVTSPEYGRNLLELGIGTNHDILPWVDWSVNSQLNEGAGPLHLGFGDGITGAHVDFLVRDCTHRFLPVPA